MMKRLTKLLILLVVVCTSVTSLDALIVDSLDYEIKTDYFGRKQAFGISGVVNSTTEFTTTYNGKGYFTFLKVGDNNLKLVSEFNNDIMIDEIKVNIGLSKGSDGKSVIVKYSVTNVSDESKSFKIGTYADNELALNYSAAVYKDGHSRIVVTQDDSTNYSETYGTQFSIDFSPEVNTIWLGLYDDFGEFSSNVFNESDVTSYTVDDDADSEYTYSWGDTLLANETKTYTATFNAKEAEGSTIKFYKYGESTPIVKDVLVGGSVKTEVVNEEENYIYEWNTKKDGTGSYYPANRSILVTENDMVLYEVKFDKNHNAVKDYKLTEGLNQKYVVNKDSQLNFEVNANYDLFGKIYVDNVLVEEGNYSYKNSEGNTLFTLNKKYLDNLPTGSHDIKFVFNDEGEVTTSFSVIEVSTYIDNPQTGDNIILYIVIGALSMLGFIITGIHICKRKQEV